MGICYCPLGPKASVPETTNIFFWLMLRAQIGQCAVFKTPTKLQHPYCNSFEAIAIGKLDLVLDRRNVSLFRDLATEPIFTLRISQPLNICRNKVAHTCTKILYLPRYGAEKPNKNYIFTMVQYIACIKHAASCTQLANFLTSRRIC